MNKRFTVLNMLCINAIVLRRHSILNKQEDPPSESNFI